VTRRLTRNTGAQGGPAVRSPNIDRAAEGDNRASVASTLDRTKGGLDPRRRTLILEYIEDHLSEPISRSHLASLACLSVPHFSAAFACSMGVSPCRYVRLRRIDRARRLLEETDFSITDIAFSVGFASHGHFSASFRAAVGVTPTAYRHTKRADVSVPSTAR